MLAAPPPVKNWSILLPQSYTACSGQVVYLVDRNYVGVHLFVLYCTVPFTSYNSLCCIIFMCTLSLKLNKKHLKNVGSIRHNEPPHAHSADVASGTVARRLRIDVYDNANDNNDNT